MNNLHDFGHMLRDKKKFQYLNKAVAIINEIIILTNESLSFYIALCFTMTTGCEIKFFFVVWGVKECFMLPITFTVLIIFYIAT